MLSTQKLARQPKGASNILCRRSDQNKTVNIEKEDGTESEESDYKFSQSASTRKRGSDESTINKTPDFDSHNFKPIHPVLGAFLSDVFHDPAYARKGHRLLEPGQAAQYAPIAIWEDRMYVGTASRHMGIRPENESGFPHFVGEIQGKEIVNDSGHYRPPAGLEKMIPEGYTYKEKHTGDLNSEIRLTMLSSPADYIDKVQQIRDMKDEDSKIKAIIEYLKENSLYDKAEATAYAYENDHITDLFRSANIPIEKSVNETYFGIKSEIVDIERFAAFRPLTIEKRKKLNLLTTQLRRIEEITKNDTTMFRKPYSAVRELVEPRSALPAETQPLEANQNQVEHYSAPHRKSRLSTLFSCIGAKR